MDKDLFDDLVASLNEMVEIETQEREPKQAETYSSTAIVLEHITK